MPGEMLGKGMNADAGKRIATPIELMGVENRDR